MPAFVHPALLWGLGLLAAPILIHLINLWRHRPVPWAAMEFLLESQKKNHRWVRLRQLLLLLARMSVIALLVLVLAQPLLGNRLGGILGESKTHHVILLDDSYSMADRWGDTSAIARGKGAVDGIVERAGAASPGQQFTLLRFSQAGSTSGTTRTDFHSARLNAPFRAELKQRLGELAPSQTDAGPLAALKASRKLLDPASGEHVILYVVSDFRTNQWRSADALREELASWRAQQAEVHLVGCVDEVHSNLGITALHPQRGLLAAGVPFFVEVSVKNFAHEAATNVAVSLGEDGHARPAVLIDSIGAGEVATQRFLVNFPTAGEHIVTAALEADSVTVDNNRALVIDLPIGVPVLIVDGAVEARDAQFLALALAPGGGIRTGVDVRLEAPRYLVDHPLAKFRTIYLTNAANLDESAVAALESYVRAGGGLAIFLGEASDSRFVNEHLHRDGKGVFPLPIASPTQLFVDRLNPKPDLEVTDHPIFKVFLGERNSFLASVGFDRYFTVRKNAEQAAAPTTKVIARLRNGAPLAIERKFGDGRVVAFLSTASPEWNNWGRNPSFVVAMLELQSYLAASDQLPEPRLVGTPLAIEFDATRFQPRVRFTVPTDAEPAQAQIDGVRKNGQFEVVLTDTSHGGIYHAELTSVEGRIESRNYAVQAPTDEGNLDLRTNQELSSALPGIKFAYHRALGFDWGSRELAGRSLSHGLLYLLVGLLIGEQLLAFRASYHPTARTGGRG